MVIRIILIVGYFGEIEEDFNILKEWVQEMCFECLGCFIYLYEENMYVYNLEDDVFEEVKM